VDSIKEICFSEVGYSVNVFDAERIARGGRAVAGGEANEAWIIEDFGADGRRDLTELEESVGGAVFVDCHAHSGWELREWDFCGEGDTPRKCWRC